MYLLYIVGRYTLQCKQENLSLIGLILENKKKSKTTNEMQVNNPKVAWEGFARLPLFFFALKLEHCSFFYMRGDTLTSIPRAWGFSGTFASGAADMTVWGWKRNGVQESPGWPGLCTFRCLCKLNVWCGQSQAPILGSWRGRCWSRARGTLRVRIPLARRERKVETKGHLGSAPTRLLCDSQIKKLENLWLKGISE